MFFRVLTHPLLLPVDADVRKNSAVYLLLWTGFDRRNGWFVFFFVGLVLFGFLGGVVWVFGCLVLSFFLFWFFWCLENISRTIPFIRRPLAQEVQVSVTRPAPFHIF